jgi:hypothetical protein
MENCNSTQSLTLQLAEPQRLYDMITSQPHHTVMLLL